MDAFCENLSIQELISKAVDHHPDVFGINCSTHTFLDTIAVIQGLKERLPEVITVLGGYHATFTSDKILRTCPFIDYVVKGEAEISFTELLNRIENQEGPSDVPGVGYFRDGVTVDNDFVLIDDLDSLPFPDRSMLNGVEYGYTHQGIFLTPGKFTTMSTSRGCPFRCRYCSCSVLSKGRWRQRSPENVVDELEELWGDGYQTCVIVDDLFTQNRKRVQRICELIRERGIEMSLYCESRVDRADISLLKDMKKAGFDVLYLGAESASNKVLDFYDKRITPQQIRKAVRNAKQVGMLVITSYILGAPVEEQQDIQMTIDLIRETQPHGIQVNILDCLVGTPIWSDLEKKGLPGKADWKTNHRIYEYFDNFTKEELDGFANECYEAHMSAWFKPSSLLEIGKLFLANKSLRRIIRANIGNPNLKKRIRNSDVYKDLESCYDAQATH